MTFFYKHTFIYDNFFILYNPIKIIHNNFFIIYNQTWIIENRNRKTFYVKSGFFLFIYNTSLDYR
jgi:hypothetical protein